MYQDFAAGAVLTATQMDGVMRQTLMTFASTAARDSALSGVLTNGMHTYQTDTNTITMYNGSAWRIVHRSETAFTPTWTNLSIGTGSNAGFYSRSGDRVFVDVGISLGTGFSITGSPSIALPVPMDTSSFAFGSGIALDFGTARYLVVAQADPSGGQACTPLVVGGSGLISSTAPFTWAANDTLAFTFTYNAA